MKCKRRQRGLLAGVALAWLAATVGAALPADHDDTPALKAMPRHDARITDLHVFTRLHPGPGNSSRRYLVLALSTNPTIPDGAATYTFPSDLTLEIRLDRHSDVDFAVDPEATLRYGGTILDPDGIAADITFTITFDAAGMPRLLVDGLDADVPISLFAGLRDDPFIRGSRQGRNSASVVIELPLQIVAAGRPHANLLVWAMSSVPGPAGPIGDLGARADTESADEIGQLAQGPVLKAARSRGVRDGWSRRAESTSGSVTSPRTLRSAIASRTMRVIAVARWRNMS